MTNQYPEYPDNEPAQTGSALLTRAQQATGAARKREGGEAWVFSVRDEVAELLTGSPFEVDSYLQNAYRVVRASPQLTEAARGNGGATVLGGIILGATLQLPIGGPLGQFYLTPRSQKNGDSWDQVCVPMIGYRGFFELGYRSGHVAFYDYLIVRRGDTFKASANSERGKFFDWDQFEGGEFDEDDADGKVRPLTHVVALARMNSGHVQHLSMSRSAIDRRKPRKTKGTPWESSDPVAVEGMYVKTPHRAMAKFQHLTIAQATAADADEHITMWNKATQAIDVDHSEDDEIEGEEAPEAPHEPATDEEVAAWEREEIARHEAAEAAARGER